MTARDKVIQLGEQIGELNKEIERLERRKKELVWQQNEAFKKWRDELAQERVLQFGEVGYDD